MSTRILPIGSYVKFNIGMRRIQPPVVTTSQSEVTQIQDQGSLTTSGSAPVQQARSVMRNLFGPIDHEENLKFVHEELNKITEADTRRWNFDFTNDVPLEGRYSWKVAKGSDVPPAYEMPNLTARLNQLGNTKQVVASTSKVTATTNVPKVASSCSPSSTTATAPSSRPADSSLRSTISAVTTATTTIPSIVTRTVAAATTTTTATTEISSSEPESKSILVKKNKSLAARIPAKQTQITDYLKVRKRSLSPTESDKSSGGGNRSSSEGTVTASPPVLKRARTSTT